MPRSHLVTLGGLTPPAGADTANWFVSKNGNNTTGTSWANAWTDLDQIVWASVAAGDVIAVDGGSTRLVYPTGYDFASHATARPGLTGGMVYTGALAPTKSGTSGSPITIRASNEPGRDGTVVLFGGRSSLLPEAGSSGYTQTGTTTNYLGANLRGRSYITIDGLRRSGIIMYGWGGVNGVNPVSTYSTTMVTDACGIALNATSGNITLRNLEIFDCGTWARVTTDSTYKSDQPGVQLGGSNVTIDRCLIHDCGQDAIQAQYALSNFTLSNSWVYFRRLHSVWSGFGFNAGNQQITAQNTTHVDGFQAFAGGAAQAGPTFDHVIAGPNLWQGLYVGDSSTGASFDNTTMTHCTILAPFAHGIQGDNISGTGGTVSPKNWTIDHCTIHGLQWNGVSSWIPIEVQGGSGGTLTNTIYGSGGNFHDPAVFTTSSNNYYYGSMGPVLAPGATSRDPVWVQALTTNTPTWAQYEAVDLTPTVSMSGAGSELNSIAALMARIDTLNV